jgi:uncharacterized protein YbaR (Trm112 family)
MMTALFDSIGPIDRLTNESNRPTPTQEPLVYDAEHHALLSETIGVRYPIDKETGIPNMIPREATLAQQGDEGEGERGQQ